MDTENPNPDANSGSASSAGPSASTAPTIDSAIAQAIAKAMPAPSQGAADDTANADPAKEASVTDDQTDKPTEGEPNPEDNKDKADPKVDPKADTEQTKPDKKQGPIPYERFQEVITAKNTAEGKIAELEPLATAYRSIHDTLSRSNVSNEEFRFWMNVAAAAKTNPIEALAQLEPHLKSWQTMKGEVLPADVQKAVDDGRLDLELAKRLVAAEGQQRFIAQQAEAQKQQQQAQMQAQLAQTYHSALTTWADSKKAGDPDFREKVGPNAKDGKFELFAAMLDKNLKQVQVRNVADLIAVAERTYAGIGETVSGFVPRQNGKPVLRTTQSQSIPQAQPKTVEEAIERRLADKHGISVKLAR